MKSAQSLLPMAELKLMLIDDHSLVRTGFKSLLVTFENIAVVAQASCGEDALDLFKLHRPDIVILEIDLPGMGGIETIKQILGKYPKTKIIVLTVHEEIIYLKRALALGALGFLSKKSAGQTLHDAVKSVAQKKRFVDPDLSHKLFLDDLDQKTDPLQDLSAREFGVFLQFAKGLSLQQVAERLYLSQGTVSTHLYRIKQKLQLSNNSELILIARRLGLTPSND
jgi:two-component system invasion response regulator UvrY